MGSCTHRQQAQMRIGRIQQRLGFQRVPHAGRLFRTRAACPVHGRGCPDSEQQAHVRMRRPRLHIAGLRALQRAWCRAAPLLSHAGRLSRTRAAYSARGPPIPHAGRLSRTWAGLPRLGTAGPRADEKAAPRHAKHEPQQHDTSYNPTCEPPRLEGATGPVGPAGPAGTCRASDRPLRAAGSRRAYCRSDSSRFARTTMPMRSTIASSTQLPSSAARRGCTGASSKRRSKPRIARHRGMSSSW